METAKINLLGRAMDAYNLRLQTLTANIANLDTPGYQRMSVSFEDQLQNARHALSNGDAAKRVEAQVEIEDRPPVLEDELMELADTQMRAQFALQALSGSFGSLRMGITGNTGG